MKAIRWGWVLVLALAFAPMTIAQTSSSTAKTDEILRKARMLDLLNHILPLVLTKDQINKILPGIEKCRKRVKEIEKMEAADLQKMEPLISKAVDDGLGKDAVPKKEVLAQVAKLFQAFYIRRDIAANENAEDMLVVLKSTLNAGQLKTAAESLDMKTYLPGRDVKTITDDEKLKVFIKDIVLDPLSYDFLVKLSKIKS